MVDGLEFWDQLDILANERNESIANEDTVGTWYKTEKERQDETEMPPIATTTSSPVASVCCFQLPRQLFLPVDVGTSRESSIAQTILKYEHVHSLVVVVL